MIKQYMIKGLLSGILLTAVVCRLSAQSGADSVSAPGKYEQTEPGRLLNLQKRYSTSAVSSVSGTILYQTPVPNVTNTLYGRLPGLTVLQTSGEPGSDDALTGIRGIGSYGFLGGAGGYNTYKIFVDGFETNSNYFRNLSPAEIESVSVLKDAAALATFGMRGANGVVWVTTKRGKIGPPSVQVQLRGGLQSALVLNKPLNSYEYARLYNQAISNDNRNVWTPRYTETQLQAYKNGTGTNVDWYKETLKDNTPYTDADVTFSGGDQTARYNVVLNYAGQNGLYNVGNTDSTSNLVFKRYNVRTNLNFNMFKIVEARIDLGGRIENRLRPNYTTAAFFNDLATYPSNIYPIKDPVTGNWSGTTLFRNNPVASLNELGWLSTTGRFLQGNFELKENLDGITHGLYLKEAYSFNNYALSGYNKSATYARYMNGATTTTDQTTAIKANAQSPIEQSNWKQASLTAGYERQFGDHQVMSAVNYHQSDYRGDGFYSLIYHYQNISGRANYTYKNRYVGEVAFSYFGTDAYAPGNRWGLYPAVSAAWIVSNESFLKDNSVFSFLKIRASVGKTGSADAEGGGSPQAGQNGRYLYQQYYQASTGFYTGDGTATGQTVLNPIYIANPGIFAEKSMKYNVGADISLFKKLDLSLDIFLDKRSDIITRDNSLPGSLGNNVVISNLGKQTNKGFEATAVYTDKAGAFGYSITGMAAYNKNRIDYMAETAPAYNYNAATGRPYGTMIGLVSNGFYQTADFNPDGTLKAGQAVPAFGAVQAGDLKYKDLDNNGKVDDNDRTAIGKSLFPQLTYAFGLNVNYSHFDLGVFMQGVSGYSVNMLANSNQTQAFANNGNAYAIAEGAWAYYPAQNIDTRATATYPRLTTVANTNNYRTSSFWVRNGDFMRVRNMEVGYTLSQNMLTRLHLSKLRIYVNAVNPFTMSTLLKEYNIDPETRNAGYPGLKSVNAGISLTF